MENEIWKDVVGYEGLYMVSNMGRIKSLDRVVKHNYGGTAIKKGKILSPTLNGSGYVKYHLKDGDKHRTACCHILVWEAFKGPIPKGMQVNHINENKLDNRLENLNLMTPKENTNWGTGIARRSKTKSITMKGKCLLGDNSNAKPVVQYDKDGKIIKEFDSLKSASQFYGISYQTIWQHLKGKTKTCHNSIWKIKKDVV